MTKTEAITILWNMRADYIKANECGLATKGEFKKQIDALTYVINKELFEDEEPIERRRI